MASPDTTDALAEAIEQEGVIVRCTTPEGRTVDFAHVTLYPNETPSVEESDEDGLWIRAKEDDVESHTVTRRTVVNLAERCEPEVELIGYRDSRFPEMTNTKAV